MDSVSRKPTVDMSDVTYRISDFDIPYEPKDKQISKANKFVEETFSRDLPSTSEINHASSLVFKYGEKSCEKCGFDRFDPTPGVKLEYCGGCRRVCYCSKECQNADWEDHRLICPGKTSKSSEGQSKSKKKGKRSEPKGKK